MKRKRENDSFLTFLIIPRIANGILQVQQTKRNIITNGKSRHQRPNNLTNNKCSLSPRWYYNRKIIKYLESSQKNPQKESKFYG